jgi:lipopolysaccharide transport system permease protein
MQSIELIRQEPSGKKWVLDVWQANVYITQLKELYRYRSLTWNLVMRELKARYRGSVLGFMWSFLNPLLLMLVYTMVFSVNMRFGMAREYVPYLISGLLPWLWFSSSLIESSGAILGGGNLIKKVLFPAEVLPLVVVISNFIHFLFSLPILLIFVLIFQRPVGLALISAPIVMLLQMLLTIGLSLLFSALCVHYRDIQHILGNLLTLWFFLTPIVYHPGQIPSKIQAILDFNPVTPLIVAYHKIFYEGQFPEFRQLFVAAIIAVLTYLLGASIFDRYRVMFAEEV